MESTLKKIKIISKTKSITLEKIPKSYENLQIQIKNKFHLSQDTFSLSFKSETNENIEVLNEKDYQERVFNHHIVYVEININNDQVQNVSADQSSNKEIIKTEDLNNKQEQEHFLQNEQEKEKRKGENDESAEPKEEKEVIQQEEGEEEEEEEEEIVEEEEVEEVDEQMEDNIKQENEIKKQEKMEEEEHLSKDEEKEKEDRTEEDNEEIRNYLNKKLKELNILLNNVVEQHQIQKQNTSDLISKLNYSREQEQHYKLISKILHQGFSCSNCNDYPLQGRRYQCLQCPNINYCNKCREIIEHDHDFIVITHPKRTKVLDKIVDNGIELIYPNQQTELDTKTNNQLNLNCPIPQNNGKQQENYSDQNMYNVQQIIKDNHIKEQNQKNFSINKNNENQLKEQKDNNIPNWKEKINENKEDYCNVSNSLQENLTTINLDVDEAKFREVYNQLDLYTFEDLYSKNKIVEFIVNNKYATRTTIKEMLKYSDI